MVQYCTHFFAIYFFIPYLCSGDLPILGTCWSSLFFFTVIDDFIVFIKQLIFLFSCWEAVRLLLIFLLHTKMWWISLTTYPFAHEYEFLQGFPRGASGKEPACQWRSHRCRFDPWVGKIPWRRAWQPTPVFLPGGSHGQRSLAGYSS